MRKGRMNNKFYGWCRHPVEVDQLIDDSNAVESKVVKLSDAQEHVKDVLNFMACQASQILNTMELLGMGKNPWQAHCEYVTLLWIQIILPYVSFKGGKQDYSWFESDNSGAGPAQRGGRVNDRREPAVSYRWTGWVWEITGWSWGLQESYR